LFEGGKTVSGIGCGGISDFDASEGGAGKLKERGTGSVEHGKGGEKMSRSEMGQRLRGSRSGEQEGGRKGCGSGGGCGRGRWASRGRSGVKAFPEICIAPALLFR
jgi:hypothetical protein